MQVVIATLAGDVKLFLVSSQLAVLRTKVDSGGGAGKRAAREKAAPWLAGASASCASRAIGRPSLGSDCLADFFHAASFV